MTIFDDIKVVVDAPSVRSLGRFPLPLQDREKILIATGKSAAHPFLEHSRCYARHSTERVAQTFAHNKTNETGFEREWIIRRNYIELYSSTFLLFFFETSSSRFNGMRCCIKRSLFVN